MNRCSDQGTLGLTDWRSAGILLLRELADSFSFLKGNCCPISCRLLKPQTAASEGSEFRLEPCSRRLTFRMPEPLSKSRFNPDAAKEKVT
jgi:hypothetical protein